MKSQDKSVLIVMDGIEKPISADPSVGPQQLLQALNQLVSTWAKWDLRIKLLVTCVSTVWDFFASQNLITWSHYYTRWTDKPLSLGALNTAEFRAAFREYFGPIPSGNDKSVAEIQRICEGDPFVLKLISDPKLRPLVLKGNVTSADVFTSYYNERILGRSLGPQKERFLALFVRWLIKIGQEDIPAKLAQEFHQLAYQALLADGILRVNHAQETVQLQHARLTAFLIGHYLDREYPAGRMDLETLGELILNGSRGFHALWDATVGYLACWGTADRFLAMTRSGDYQQQEIIVDALETAAKSRSRPTTNVSHVLSALLRDDARPARATGLRLASRLRLSDSGQIGDRLVEEIFREVMSWMKQDPAAAAEHVYLSWREFKDTRYGVGIWDDLERFIEKNLNEFAAMTGLLARLPVRRPVVWGADKALTIRQRLTPIHKRNESYLALIEFTLSVAWHILINEYNDDITIQKISRLWSGTQTKAGVNLKLAVAFKRAERALPNITQERVVRFLRQTLPEVPPYFPPEGPFLAELLDPRANVGQRPEAEEKIFTLLEAEQITPVALTALALSQQAHRDFQAVELLLRRLFARCSPTRQLALLAGFALHAEHKIPEGLIPTLEDFTRVLVTAQPDYLTNPTDPWGRLQKYRLPVVLAPLGLTWCNSPAARGSLHIEPIVRMAAELGWSRDPALFRGAVDSLVPVGIYFPEPVLHTLLQMGAFEAPGSEPWLGKALAMIQTFNGERVDRFLRDQHLAIRPKPLRAAEVQKLLSFFYWLSTSNFIYYSLSVDNLRTLWAGAIRALASVPPPSIDQVGQQLSKALARVLYEKNFQLDRILNESVRDPEALIRLIAGPA